MSRLLAPQLSLPALSGGPGRTDDRPAAAAAPAPVPGPAPVREEIDLRSFESVPAWSSMGPQTGWYGHVHAFDEGEDDRTPDGSPNYHLDDSADPMAVHQPSLAPLPPFVGDGPSSGSSAWPARGGREGDDRDGFRLEDRFPSSDRRLQRAVTTDFRHMLPTWSGLAPNSVGRGSLPNRMTSLWSEMVPTISGGGVAHEQEATLRSGSLLDLVTLPTCDGEDPSHPPISAQQTNSKNSTTLPSDPLLVPSKPELPDDATAAAAAAEADAVAPEALGGVAGLNDVLTAYGPPSEWWHDAIILGRLSALAQRYFATRACRRPWEAWKGCVSEAHEKRARQNAARRTLALRKWRFRTLFSGKGSILANGKRIRLNKDKLQLLFALRLVFAAACRPALERLRIVAFFKRDLERQMRLLHLVEARVLGTLAKTHYYKNLMRAGLAAFWIVWQLAAALPPEERKKASAAPQMRDKAEEASPAANHILQVTRRAWRRWRWSTAMWLSPTEYDARLTEAWLMGASDTPRSHRGPGDPKAPSSPGPGAPPPGRGFLSGSNFMLSPDGSGIILLQNESCQTMDTTTALNPRGHQRDLTHEELPFPSVSPTQAARPTKPWAQHWVGARDVDEGEASPNRYTVPLRQAAARGLPIRSHYTQNTKALSAMEELRGKLMGRRGLTPPKPRPQISQGEEPENDEEAAEERHFGNSFGNHKSRGRRYPEGRLQADDSDQECEFVVVDPPAVGNASRGGQRLSSSSGSVPQASSTGQVLPGPAALAGEASTTPLLTAAAAAAASLAPHRESSSSLQPSAQHQPPRHAAHHHGGPSAMHRSAAANGAANANNFANAAHSSSSSSLVAGVVHQPHMPGSGGSPTRGTSTPFPALDGGYGTPRSGAGESQSYWAARNRIAPAAPRREVKLRGAG